MQTPKHPAFPAVGRPIFHLLSSISNRREHKHEGEAASWAGNSPSVIHRHYKGLVKEADANEY